MLLQLCCIDTDKDKKELVEVLSPMKKDGRCYYDEVNSYPLGQVGANLLHLARVAILYANQLRNRSTSDATVLLDKAKYFLENCIRLLMPKIISLVSISTCCLVMQF